MLRVVVAFLVAPLVVPIFAGIYFRGLLAHPDLVVMVLCLSTITAYAGTQLLGVPTYFLLRSRNWTAFWLAPLLGFIAGGLTWWLFSGVILMGESLRFEPVWNLGELMDAFWPFGPVGAVVGGVLWFIARPDRAAAP